MNEDQYMVGWVSRAKYGHLVITEHRPKRFDDCFVDMNGRGKNYYLPPEVLEGVTWENSPKKIHITISEPNEVTFIINPTDVPEETIPGKELMIGDWYQTAEGKFSRILALPLSDNMVDKCHPIPLTDNILDSNPKIKRKKDMHGEEIDEWTEEELRVLLKKEDAWYIHISSLGGLETGSLLGKHYFTYVHELQNILRLSGLHDIADNFKLSKSLFEHIKR